jgi:hypothetical protein
MAHRRISPFLPKNFLPDAPFTDNLGLLDSWEIIPRNKTQLRGQKYAEKQKIEKNKKSSQKISATFTPSAFAFCLIQLQLK